MILTFYYHTDNRDEEINGNNQPYRQEIGGDKVPGQRF